MWYEWITHEHSWYLVPNQSNNVSLGGVWYEYATWLHTNILIVFTPKLHSPVHFDIFQIAFDYPIHLGNWHADAWTKLTNAFSKRSFCFCIYGLTFIETSLFRVQLTQSHHWLSNHLAMNRRNVITLTVMAYASLMHIFLSYDLKELIWRGRLCSLNITSKTSHFKVFVANISWKGTSCIVSIIKKSPYKINTKNTKNILVLLTLITCMSHCRLIYD